MSQAQVASAVPAIKRWKLVAYRLAFGIVLVLPVLLGRRGRLVWLSQCGALVVAIWLAWCHASGAESVVAVVGLIAGLLLCWRREALMHGAMTSMLKGTSLAPQLGKVRLFDKLPARWQIRNLSVGILLMSLAIAGVAAHVRSVFMLPLWVLVGFALRPMYRGLTFATKLIARRTSMRRQRVAVRRRLKIERARVRSQPMSTHDEDGAAKPARPLPTGSVAEQEVRARARELCARSVRLASEGRRTEALTAAQKAVELARGLVKNNPSLSFTLAGALFELAHALHGVDRNHEALAACEEAVRYYRPLSAEWPREFMGILAAAIDDQGLYLTMSGRARDGLAATEEATAVRRKLVHSDPTRLRDLATSLTNLGRQLLHVGRVDDALAPAEEAVGYIRTLAAEDPEAHMDALAKSLDNVGSIRSMLGQAEDGLVASEEALELHRALAETNPDLYLEDLAINLNVVTSQAFALGKLKQALWTCEESVLVYEQIARGRPNAALRQHGAMLAMLDEIHARLGRFEDGLVATEQSIGLFRNLAKSGSTVSSSILASRLEAKAKHLAGLGRHEEVLEAIREALEIRRRLAALDPDQHSAALATALKYQAAALVTLGRQEAALASIEESITLARQMFANGDRSIVANLADSLSRTVGLLIKMGRIEQARQAAEEALTYKLVTR